MGRDNQPKDRQLRRKVAKEARRASYARILIVTEGQQDRAAVPGGDPHCLSTAFSQCGSAAGPLGTAPIQVVRYAQQLFEEGDLNKGIRPKSFDQVYAVFDRDDHDSYFNALSLANRWMASCAMTTGSRSASRPSPPSPASSYGCCCTTRTFRHRFIATR
jgi:hypothetical protein